MSLLRLVLCVALLWGTAGAHDLFLKFESWFLAPNSDVEVDLFNGTFDSSDNVITRDRMLDVSVVGADGSREHPAAEQWRDVDNRTRLAFRTGASGTYVIGVSTGARVFELSGEDFDGYLEHDGVLDVLEARRAAGILGEPARERYSKHVKAIAQVGAERTDAALTALAYPIEIVPLVNPYRLDVGDVLPVRVDENGAPLAGQLVYASHGAHHVHDEDGNHVEAFRGRTDAAGVVRIPIEAPGRHYVRLIRMGETPDEPDVDYESNWATLTFEMRDDAQPRSRWLFMTISTVALAVGVVLWWRSRRVALR